MGEDAAHIIATKSPLCRPHCSTDSGRATHIAAHLDIFAQLILCIGRRLALRTLY